MGKFTGNFITQFENYLWKRFRFHIQAKKELYTICMNWKTYTMNVYTDIFAHTKILYLRDEPFRNLIALWP
jgi:hypothetical protein